MSDDSEHVMTNVNIYERPQDFPHGWVVRTFDIIRGNPEPRAHREAMGFLSLEEARRYVLHCYPHLIDLGPDADNPMIVAVYL